VAFVAHPVGGPKEDDEDDEEKDEDEDETAHTPES
jgi:hypothetical protein